jgi:hypothetical protein
MTSLLVLATLYLFAALVLVLIIDRSVGLCFPHRLMTYTPRRVRRFRTSRTDRRLTGKIGTFSMVMGWFSHVQ